jgi:hypothetical protein
LFNRTERDPVTLRAKAELFLELGLGPRQQILVCSSFPFWNCPAPSSFLAKKGPPG